MSASPTWDPARVKAQLYLAAQRLGQLQDKKDSLAHITSRDIATLLGQRNVSLARTKAQNLMKDDALSNAMEVLEMYCGLVLERFSELDDFKFHPSTVEAVASIIYAAGLTECQELAIVRGMLAERLGPEFAQSALHNSDGHVSQRILRLVHSAPSADNIDAYLWNIARKFNVDWKPQMKMDEKLAILSEMLDASDTLGTVNLERLREIAFSGVPMDPSWLRPRVWKLLLGITPLLKVQWESESQRKRNDYYDLIRRLLVNVPSLPRPTFPPPPADKALLALVESLSRVPAHLFRGLEDEIEQSPFCPVHDTVSPDIKIDFAFALDARLHLIQDQSSKGDEDSSITINATPEIRLDSGSAPSSPQEITFDLSEAAQGERSPQSPARMLSSSVTLAPKAFRSIPAHPSHVSALLRLLYTHKSLNPGSESPYLASLLLPVYTVMNQEADPAELAHAEADTFWTFEVLIREVSELDETEGGVVWMKKLRERLAMADNELSEDLAFKGLDPGLPQYSYRWLAPVLSHTLPLPSVLMAWDSIFAEPEMSRQSNPRLEHLLNICTAMLVRARARLLLLGKGRRSPSLWEIDPSGVERQTLRPWELGDAFMEGMTLLQNYPIKEAGSMERVLQVAGDIYLQKQQLEKPPQTQGTGLAAIIRDRMWRGITNQSTEGSNSPEDSDEDSGDETETGSERMQTKSNVEAVPTASGWGSYFKSTVIRGITNESAMDPAYSATSPLPSPISSPRRASHEAPPSSLLRAQADMEKPSTHLTVPSTSSFWCYAERLRQSDMAAKLSKASTNLSAKALDAWTARSVSATTVPDKRHKSSDSVSVMDCRIVESPDNGFRWGSLPSISQSNTYSPPPRPAFFRPPRDTRMFLQEELDSLKVLDSPESTHSSLSASTVSAGERGKLPSTIASVLPSWAGIQPKLPKPLKTAPKPLLLSARSSVLDSGHSIQISRSANSTPVPINPDWSEVLRNKAMGSPQRRDSQYSQTSFSSRTSNNSASPKESRGGWDSDQSVSRIVRLNRGSISPMAPAFRVARTSSRNASISSQSEFGVLSYMTASESSPSAASAKLRDEVPRSTRNYDRVSPDSPATLPSSPPPRTPVTNGGPTQSSVRVADAERQRGSLVLSEPGFYSIDATPRTTARKPSVVTAGDTSDSSLPSASLLTRNAPRVRTKRFPRGHGRPPSLRIRESATESDRKNASISISNASSSSLAAPEFDSEFDIATTPRAAQFPPSSPTEASPRSPPSPRRNKVSMEEPERRRKLSNEMNGITRTRKLSNESRTTRTRKISNGSYSRRDSVADDGDDEGYDDVLSAYESEDTKHESVS